MSKRLPADVSLVVYNIIHIDTVQIRRSLTQETSVSFEVVRAYLAADAEPGTIPTEVGKYAVEVSDAGLSAALSQTTTGLALDAELSQRCYAYLESIGEVPATAEDWVYTPLGE